MKYTTGTFLFLMLLLHVSGQDKFYQKAEELRLSDKYVKALAFYNRSLEKENVRTQVLVGRGLCYYATGDFALSRIDLTEALNQEDISEEDAYKAMLFTGEVYRMNEQFDESAYWLDSLVYLYPYDGSALKARGILKVVTKDFKGAIEDLTRGIKQAPEDAFMYEWRGMAYFQSREFENAITDFNRALELDPDRFKSVRFRGISYYLTRKYEKALEDANRVLEMDPSEELYYMEKHSRLESLGRIDEAQELLVTHRGAEIQEHTYFYFTANHYFLTKRYKESLPYMELYDEYRTKLFYNNYGYILLELKRYKEAIPFFEKLLDLDEESYLANNNMGFAYLRLGNLEKASELIEKSLKINPENSYAYRNRALIWLEKGEKMKACEEWQNAIYYRHFRDDKDAQPLEEACTKR